MHDINWWLMAAGFLLGLLLTFAFMIRRVKREVPVSALAAAGGAAAAKFVGGHEPYGAGSARGRCRRQWTGGLDDQGQRGVDALPHARQPQLQADHRRSVV